MRRTFIHQHPDWPRFHWDWREVATLLAATRHHQGLLLGRVASLGFETNRELAVDNLTTSVVSSSRIEGELLDIEQVRSSVARQLVLNAAGLAHSDRNVDGEVEMLLDAVEKCDEPLMLPPRLKFAKTCRCSGNMSA